MFYWRKSVEKLASFLLGMLALKGTEEAAKRDSAQGPLLTFNRKAKQSEGKQGLAHQSLSCLGYRQVDGLWHSKVPIQSKVLADGSFTSSHQKNTGVGPGGCLWSPGRGTGMEFSYHNRQSPSIRYQIPWPGQHQVLPRAFVDPCLCLLTARMLSLTCGLPQWASADWSVLGANARLHCATRPRKGACLRDAT